MKKEEKLKQKATSYGIYIGSKNLSKVEIIEQLTEFAKSPEVAQYHQQSEAGDVKTAEEILKATFNECAAYLDPSVKGASLIAMREFAAQFTHSQEPVDMESIKSKFIEHFSGYKGLNEDRVNEIFVWLNSHLKQPVESDAVSFLIWVQESKYIYSSNYLWYYMSDGNPESGITTIELYHQYQQSKITHKTKE